jgi:hypothetical protein
MNHQQLLTQINAHLRRLGWTHQDDIRYVQTCFVKPSRSFLTTDELQEYLNFLQSQPGGEVEPITQGQNQLNLFEL